MTPRVSAQCAAGDHERCPHWAGLGVRGAWRLRPRQVVVVCPHPWHAGTGCPVAGRRVVARDEWAERCTCPGADASRRAFSRSAAQREQLRAVVAGVDLADRPDAATVEQRLREAFRASGAEPPPGLGALSGALVARSGPAGTRTARLSWMGLRAAGRAVRETWRPGGDGGPRTVQAVTGAVLAVAVLLTVAAARTSGWRRVAVALTAALAWRLAARVLLGAAVVTTVVRGSSRRAG